MGLSKAEVKLRRLLASMHKQERSRKLIHYIATARELLTALNGENAQQNLPSISLEKAKEYGERIEAFAEKMNITGMPDMWEELERSCPPQVDESKTVESGAVGTLRKRRFNQLQQEDGTSSEVKLDSAGHEYIGKHLRLQDDLSDEMVGFARHIKESTLLMQQALRDTDQVMDSTERAVERSLDSTNRATRRAGLIHSRAFTTGCYTWLLIFAMFCAFIFMIAVIRIT